MSEKQLIELLNNLVSQPNETEWLEFKFSLSRRDW